MIVTTLTLVIITMIMTVVKMTTTTKGRVMTHRRECVLF